MRQNKDGDSLYKRMTFKLVIPGQKPVVWQYLAKGKNRGFSEKAIENQLECVIEHINKSFLKLEFKQVQLLPNAYNFICTGKRESLEEKVLGE